jgi:hypothetical protein
MWGSRITHHAIPHHSTKHHTTPEHYATPHQNTTPHHTTPDLNNSPRHTTPLYTTQHHPKTHHTTPYNTKSDYTPHIYISPHLTCIKKFWVLFQPFFNVKYLFNLEKGSNKR